MIRIFLRFAGMNEPDKNVTETSLGFNWDIIALLPDTFNDFRTFSVQNGVQVGSPQNLIILLQIYGYNAGTRKKALGGSG
jgi:hypothetical protein